MPSRKSQPDFDAVTALVNTGAIGIATVNASGTVLSSRGLFSDHLQPGSCVWADFPPLCGMRSELERCISFGKKLSLTQVGLPSKSGEFGKAHVKVVWDAGAGTFLLVILKDETFSEHQAVMRRVRLQRVVQECMATLKAVPVPPELPYSPEPRGDLPPSTSAAEEAGPADHPLKTLTTRELQVVQLLGRGRSNKAIAHELGISPRTVEVYRAKAVKRLGLRTTAELLRLAGEHGVK
jgi:DNA-binding CsgD family transcriptional regulator